MFNKSGSVNLKADENRLSMEGTSNEFNWILRGPEASIYPIWTIITNVISGGASGFSINVGGATYLGPVSEINRSIVETKFREGGVGTYVSVPFAEGLSATGGYTPGANGAPGIISGSLSFDPLAGEIGDVPVPKYGVSFSNTYKVKDFKPESNEK
ncbi:hypothetical protein [Chitinophaga sp. LS1]|uniref:hypothetical protein n=1 Tax=Chitinophaga sp. LS1 TaxID=3051176 RepID=UPI002AAB8BDE|nr:hypothetical protein [Chitinophaga sp. LS1]WPV64050.1 hypothetical protein QQL36_19810 [Chitinophaga sp. LS1]